MAAPPDLVVIEPAREWSCAEWGGTGNLLIMDDHKPLCLTCADLDYLVFLPAGDAALTRRAKKASRLPAVVVQWSRTRKRYERRGILVEEPALEQAEQQCLADEDARMRRRERDRERRADSDAELQVCAVSPAWTGQDPDARRIRQKICGTFPSPRTAPVPRGTYAP